MRAKSHIILKMKIGKRINSGQLSRMTQNCMQIFCASRNCEKIPSLDCIERGRTRDVTASAYVAGGFIHTLLVKLSADDTKKRQVSFLLSECHTLKECGD
jgi:hypothetical protein